MNAPTVAVKLCSADVRRGVEIQPCGNKLSRGECSKRADHQFPFPTGFCDSGWHEGDKVNKPTCKFYMHCPCKCHQDLWFMFSLSDMERVAAVDNSIWKAHIDFVMPSKEERIRERIRSSLQDTDGPTLVKSPAPGIVPDALAVAYAPTPSGRAARGELEQWVREVTDSYSVDPGVDIASPQWIAECIAKVHGLGRPPSSGAVDAVLKRWVRIGFAEIEFKPTRFTRYTEAGVKFGLEFMKMKARLDAAV